MIILNFVLLVLLIGTSVLFFWVIRFIKGSSSKETEERINALRKEWGDTLSKNTELILKQLNESAKILQSVNQTMGERLDNAAKVVGDVKESLGALEEKSKQIYEIGKDIASLQEILRAPKIRGGMGELFLENLLEQIMPGKEYFELQYSFKSGERVDAIIRIGNRMVPVDAKFPLESFKRCIDAQTELDRKRCKKEFVRSVKEHINSIAEKYILPDEGTYDFALMYIPAENVYYETIIKDEEIGEEKSIFSHAISKKVIPVSPNSFYAYLQIIILGIKGMSIEKRVQDVIKMLGTLKIEFNKFADDFEKIGGHLNDSRSSYDKAVKSLDRFEDKLLKIDSIETPKLPEE